MEMDMIENNQLLKKTWYLPTLFCRIQTEHVKTKRDRTLHFETEESKACWATTDLTLTAYRKRRNLVNRTNFKR
jgi:hypothetical protein